MTVTAEAAAPPNDAPAGAIEFAPFGAGNLPEGVTAEEREGVADLSEATADRVRCLGPASFAKTVWYAVPAAATPQVVRVEASSPSGGTAEMPDVALYVGQSARPQACDGAALGELATSAAAVEARVPAGQTVLIQVGRSRGQFEQRVVASLRTTALEALPAPAGDAAADAPRLRKRASVALAGATLTAEDPAQPACPAAASVWRRTPVRVPGRYRLTARGPAAGTLTAFVGRRPRPGNAVACANRARSAGPVKLAVRIRKPTTLWTRVGTDAPAAGASAVLRVAAPRPRLAVTPRRRTVVVRATGTDIRRVRVVIRRGELTRRVRLGLLRAGRRGRVDVAGLPRGRYRVTVTGRAGGERVRVRGTLRR